MISVSFVKKAATAAVAAVAGLAVEELVSGQVASMGESAIKMGLDMADKSNPLYVKRGMKVWKVNRYLTTRGNGLMGRQLKGAEKRVAKKLAFKAKEVIL